ncbi:hypothetical protein HCN_1043 [Helicobacter cinaedi PAGU611]|uniref:hypothetical protein n=1 Tax=Helicobacter cinaedi TaxID=213 RepID=UPI00025D33AD|nr:hypothetical protein [Helicobacter cinaedi]BAM12274.1 hypothetical protein HCN_1043 [Helicobacter cinaedi PAGU611]
MLIENNRISIMFFRYTEDFEIAKNDYFPANKLDSILLFLEKLFNKECDGLDKMLQERCREIFLMQEKGHFFLLISIL